MRTALVIVAALMCAAGAGAQAAEQAAGPGGAAAGAPARQSQPAAEPLSAERLSLALSTEDYPVTPGDQYLLSWWQSGVNVTSSLTVQSDFAIDLGIFGPFSARGLTYLQLKKAVAKIVAATYPRALPTLSLTAVGAFRVFVTGAVPESRFVSAWGLSRLSDVVAVAAGSSSSLRDVRVISSDGTEKSYDLFKAKRLGMIDQDPYVRPGQTISLTRAAVTVEVSGQARLPGRYQMLPGEDLHTLIDTFAGGLTADADSARATLDRFTGSTVRTSFVDLGRAADDPPPQDGDVIRIPSKTADLPVVYVEGAVTMPQAQTGAPAPAAGTAAGQAALQAQNAYGRITYPWREGETVSETISALRPSLSPLANLQDAGIIHAGSSTSTWIDIEKALASPGSAADFVLQPFDRIVIPVSRFFVFISGAVSAPGSYPYAPNQTYRYYLGLVGALPAEGSTDVVTITDRQGNQRSLTDPIQPEDSIYIAPSLVTVWGAVVSPGNYAFRPGRDASYYMGLAGGVDSAKNSNGAFEVTDALGKRRSPAEPIVPGDRIHVLENSFLYNFNEYFPVFASTVTLIAAIASITSVVVGLLPH